MKANGTQLKTTQRSIIFLLLLITSLTAFSQPDYDFRNPSLISGTDKQIGAVYLFKDVKPGVDATVTIIDITGGISLDDVDGGSGYAEALQPILHVPANATGYVEFDVDFLIGGTNTPMIQLEVPATPIDVDGKDYGNGIVKEFDILQLTNGYVDYDMLGGELNINISSPWVTGYNVAAVDYPAVDTTPRQVMFTTVNANISKFTFRTGATSTSATDQQRLRSVYFKKFAYQNSMLPVGALASFRANLKDQNVNLSWDLSKGNVISKVYVERSTSQNKYENIGEIAVYSQNLHYNFTDNAPLAGTSFYRLKMIAINGTITYSSVLQIKNVNAANAKAFNIYPTFINSNATVELQSVKSEQATIRLVDYSGRVVFQQNVIVNAGANTISLNGLDRLSEGNYVAVLQNSSNETLNRKIIVQH